MKSLILAMFIIGNCTEEHFLDKSNLTLHVTIKDSCEFDLNKLKEDTTLKVVKLGNYLNIQSYAK